MREKIGEVSRGHIVKGLEVPVKNLDFRQIIYRELLKTLKQK